MVARFPRGTPPKVKQEFYKPGSTSRPMMPIEYSVAAYRFGHSMVRAGYTLDVAGGAPMFDPTKPDLRGSRPLPAALEIEWWRFYDVPGQPAGPRDQARLIDAKLAIPLLNLPPTHSDDIPVRSPTGSRTRGCGERVADAAGLSRPST